MKFAAAAPLLPFLLLLSCSSPGVREVRRPIADVLAPLGRLTVDQIEDNLQDYLKAEGLAQTYRRSPEVAVRELAERLDAQTSDSSRLKLAQICFSTGENLQERDAEEALGFFVDAAALSYRDAVANAADPTPGKMRLVYNLSATRAARILFDSGALAEGATTISAPLGVCRIQVGQGEGRTIPSYFDTLVSADHLEMKGLKHLTRIRNPGLGGRMVGHRAGSEERALEEPLLHPRAGMAIPLTAIFEFAGSGAERRVEFSLYDAHRHSEVDASGSTVPLATDFTAPLALLHNYTERGDIGFKNLKNPLRDEARTGLYQIEPFRPDQIPVVFVHGLNSSASVWLEAVNKLRADPVIRNRFQLLVFGYPTGFPIGFNAASLRKHLKQFREKFDPDGTHEAMRNMVLIGHSMGGILSNYQIRDSGMILHEKLFERPLDQTSLTKEQIEKVKPILYFEANPDIKRVVFVASPHRGSQMAEGFIGKFGSSLIKLPLKLLVGGTVREVDGMTELGNEAIQKKLTSVRSLRPGSLALTSVWELPNTYGVPMHSLIAHRDVDTPLEESTDGLVLYTSSHIDGAASEKVIVGEDHNSINTSDEAIDELRRILYHHIGLSP